jgi:hypothetical protein
MYFIGPAALELDEIEVDAALDRPIALASIVVKILLFRSETVDGETRVDSGPPALPNCAKDPVPHPSLWRIG